MMGLLLYSSLYPTGIGGPACVRRDLATRALIIYCPRTLPILVVFKGAELHDRVMRALVANVVCLEWLS